MPRAVEAWLCDSGKYKPVLLDRLFPVTNHSLTPLFARPSATIADGTWQMFLEKAYAKLYGSYKSLDLGHSSIAFNDLTGAPTEYIDLDDLNDAWFKLQRNLNKGYVITGSSLTNPSEMDEKCNIAPKHCYGVLDAVEIIWQTREIRYILLKNPVGGNGESNGKSLPTELKVMLESKSLIYNDVMNNVGLFWVSLGDLKKNFEVLTSAKINSNYCHSSLEVKNPDKKVTQFLFRATGVKGTQGHVSVFRKNMRFFTKDHVDIMKTKYGVSRIVVFQTKKNEKIEIMGYGFNSKQTSTTEITIDNEEFFVYVEMDYNISQNVDLTISTYSQKPINLEFMKEKSNHIRNDVSKSFLTALLTSYALENDRKSEGKPPLDIKEFKGKKGGVCKRIYGEMLGYVAFVYFNESESETLVDTLMEGEMKNISWHYPFTNYNRNGNGCSVGPGKVFAVVLKFGWENNCSHVSRIKTNTVYSG
jgi:hypothetical protein